MNKKTNDKTIHRSWKSQPVTGLIQKATKKAMQKRGFSEQRLLTEWSSIIGAELAAFCVPEKMVYARKQGSGASLHLRCDPSMAPQIPYLEPVMLERIATFFGYKAVERLVIHQTHIAPSEQTSPSSAPAPLLSEKDAGVEKVEDEALRIALQRLATARSGDT